MRVLQVILLTFLIISCSETETKEELSIQDRDRFRIDSIEVLIRASIDSAKNPGIGLALVQQLTQAMHGQVDVVNKSPGAEFKVRFSTQENTVKV